MRRYLSHSFSMSLCVLGAKPQLAFDVDGEQSQELERNFNINTLCKTWMELAQTGLTQVS